MAGASRLPERLVRLERGRALTARNAPPAPDGQPDGGRAGVGGPAPSRDIARLIQIMAALRTPGSGCPWDLEQTFRTITPYTVEEAYEVADAIERGDLADLREELGDLLLQVVFHARMAEEAGAFDFGGVVEAITAKLIRRHPHVFGEARHLAPDAVKAMWDAIKREEKAERAARGGQPAESGVLAGVPAAMPGLTRAEKLTRKAATVGFDWSSSDDVLAKIEEEVEEVRVALASRDADAIEDEIGDLLFATANLARHARVDGEAALRRANAKFERRFGEVERRLIAAGSSPAMSTLAEMEALWAAVKADELS